MAVRARATRRSAANSRTIREGFRSADEIILASLHPERYTKETAIDLPEMVAAWESSGRGQALKDADAIVKDLAPRLTKAMWYW